MLKQYLYSSKIRIGLGAVGCLWMLVIGGGCSTGQGELFPERNIPLYWPQPPEKPRIKYLGQLSTEDNLKKEVSSMESFKRMIFGRDNIGVLARPFGLTKDDQDNLYIADNAGSVIHIMGLKNRQYLQFHQISGPKRLVSPVGLVLFDKKIFVADSSLAEICVFDTQGRYIFSFGSECLQRPSGIAYSQKQQKLYVADSKSHVVQVFDIQGRLLDTIGDKNGDSLRFNHPTQLWVDGQDKLYVSDTLNYQVQVLNSSGDLLLTIGSHGNRPGYFAHPCGVATDNIGNIYVVDKQFENIQIFNRQGQILMAFGGEGNDPGEFWLPTAIYIDETNRIFVADSYNKRIQIFQLLEGQSP